MASTKSLARRPPSHSSVSYSAHAELSPSPTRSHPHSLPHPPPHHRCTHTHTRTRTRSSRSRTTSTSDASGLDPERSTPPREPSPPPRQENAPPPAEEVTKLRLAAHYAGLVLAGMLGCLARLGLEGLAEYDGKIIYPLAWSQGVGSGIMGVALARKNEIISIYPPIYTFLTTGIAGSITTFSSWMLEGYLAFSNYDGYNRKGLHDTVDGVAYSLSTFAIALASLKMGEHLASVLPALPIPKRSHRSASPARQGQAGDTSASPSSSTTRHDGQLDPEAQADAHTNESAPSRVRSRADGVDGSHRGQGEGEKPEPISASHLKATKKVKSNVFNQRRSHRIPSAATSRFSKSRTPLLDLVTISTAFIAYLIALLLYFLAPHYGHVSWRHSVLFPLLLSPPGAILRFFLSRYNTRPAFLNKFPMGTFVANMVATLLISGVFVAQRSPGTPTRSMSMSMSSVGAVRRCDALYAIQQGFCGCLSTVSTFIVEFRTVADPKWKWTYIATSVVLGHLFVLSIVGGTGWSRSHAIRLDPVCSGSASGSG
ncbi:hypothetical protein IAU59_005337 [Kwoniella sp. CBS 9459]